MEQLKKLLLETELEQLEKLEAALKKLDFQTQDPETILKRVTPLFNNILLERLESKDEETIAILSKYLTKIITLTSKRSLPEFSQSLQSVIAPAISKEIAANQDVMVDALYPIMGGMISKYVSTAIKEMMESINNKIEDGLSFEKYKRKLKSKVTGVSETELLIEESSDAVISSLFVIHKESGLLIAEAHLKDKEIEDPHMIASMASAIKDFINDWVQSNQSNNEVQILSYGNATLYIESAGSVYVIAFLDTEPDYELRTDINDFFASIVKKYAAFFQKFDGNDNAPEITELCKKMSDYLSLQENSKIKTKTQSKNPMKYFFLIFGFVFFSYLVYLASGWLYDYRLENKIESLTAQKVHITKDAYGHKTVEGYVDSSKNILAIDAILKKEKEPIYNRVHVSVHTIDKMIKNENTQLTLVKKEMQHSIKILSQQITALKNEVNITNQHISKVKQKNQLLETKQKNIKNIFNLQKNIKEKLNIAFKANHFYHPKDMSLDFAKLNLFSPNTAKFDKNAMQTVSTTFKKYLQILTPYIEYIEHIIIEGHTDSSGRLAENIKLSQERAKNVKDFLLSQSYMQNFSKQNLIIAKGLANTEPIKINGIENKEASRRIKIKFRFKKDKILKHIKKIIND